MFLQINEPTYQHREYKNDIADVKFQDSWADPCKRIGFAVLPFISLYKPLRFPLSLTMGGMRTVTSVTHVIESLKGDQPKNIPVAVLQMGIAAIALASTTKSSRITDMHPV